MNLKNQMNSLTKKIIILATLIIVLGGVIGGLYYKKIKELKKQPPSAECMDLGQATLKECTNYCHTDLPEYKVAVKSYEACRSNCDSRYATRSESDISNLQACTNSCTDTFLRDKAQEAVRKCDEGCYDKADKAIDECKIRIFKF